MKREMRCPHKPKISDCSECMAELNAMGAPASPEQFLREFANEIAVLKYDGAEKTIKGWAKLLELREQEARDETRRLDYAEFLGMVRHMENNASQLRRHFEHRVEALTTPNNTSNTPEEN